MTKNLSKTMAYALRHNPAAFSLAMSSEGWVSVVELAANLTVEFGTEVTVATILSVVKEDEKQRYTLNESSSLIRAAQGHSFPVELGLIPQVPPKTLYHGTIAGNVSSILAEGLKAQSRQYVHLTESIETAQKVGSRHGKQTVIFAVNTTVALQEGFLFYKAENGVWLTPALPSTFLTIT